MRQTNLKYKRNLALAVLLALLFLLTGCPNTQPPTATDSPETNAQWDSAQWDSATWQ
jgi:ABC-type uncharacterized transport system auxiliary subunit